MSPTHSNISLFSVDAILILGSADHSRIFTKYYSSPHHHAAPADATGVTNKNDIASKSTTSTTTTTTYPQGYHPKSDAYATVKDQKAFEAGLAQKTWKQNGDLILYDNRVVVYKCEGDVIIYVVGSADENEIMLYGVVLCLKDTLNLLLKNFIDKSSILENYDLVSLAIDEIVDEGIILETDPTVVASRVSRAPAQDIPLVKGFELSEQGLLNAWEFTKMKAQERLRQGLQ